MHLSREVKKLSNKTTARVMIANISILSPWMVLVVDGFGFFLRVLDCDLGVAVGAPAKNVGAPHFGTMNGDLKNLNWRVKLFC